MHPRDPRGYRVSIALTLGERPDKERFKNHYECEIQEIGFLEPGPWREGVQGRVPGGGALVHRARPVAAQREDMGPPSSGAVCAGQWPEAETILSLPRR